MTTQKSILSATARIIAEEGLDAVSIRRVCDEVGVKAPTVYYYFQSKDGLIDAVIGWAYDKHIQLYSDFVSNRPPLEGLVLTWDSFFEFVENHPDLYHAIVVAHLKRRIPKEGILLFESIADLFKKIESQQGLNLPADQAAEVFYATAYGQALVYVSQEKNPNLKDSIEFTKQMCLKNLISSKERV